MAQDLTFARRHLPNLSQRSAFEALDHSTSIMNTAGDLTVAYAPFDHIETAARLVVVGITPGRSQALNALSAVQGALRRGETVETALRVAKLTGSFSGPLRANLVAMLDNIGVAKHLSVTTTASLFRPGSTAVHFTSALRYPVFVAGKNYNGTPDILKTPILRQMVETHLAEEAQALSNALWLPLGPKAEAAVSHLVGLGLLRSEHVLSGFPHPSGANAERIAVFLGRKSPELASSKTDPARLLAARARLANQISSLEGEAA